MNARMNSKQTEPRSAGAVDAAPPPRPENAPSLGRRIFFYFGLLFAAMLAALELVFLFGLPFLDYDGEYNTYRNDAFRTLNLAADLKKERLVYWLNELQIDARAISENPLTASLAAKAVASEPQQPGDGGVSPKEMLTAYLKKVQAVYPMDWELEIMDPVSGAVLASAAHAGNDVSAAAKYSTPRPGDLLNAAPIGFQPRHGRLHLRVVRPIARPTAGEAGGETIALFLFYFDVEKMLASSDAELQGLGTSGDVLIVNQDAMLLNSSRRAFSASAPTWTPSHRRLTSKPVLLAIAGREGITTAKDDAGKTVLAAYRHIPISPELGWGLVVKRNEDEVFAPLRRRIAVMGAVGLACLLITLLASYLVSKHLSDPIRDLGNAALRVSRGDLSVQAAGARYRETIILAAAFNKMIRRVRTWNDALEKEVAARTGELTALNRELVREIDARKKTEDALTESERLLNEAQDVARIGSFSRHLKDKTQFVTQGMVKLWKYDAATDGELGRFTERYIHPEDLRKVVSMRDAFFASGEDRGEVEYRVVLKDGTRKHFHTIGHMERDEDGAPLRFYGTTQDITRRKEMEEALVKSEARIRAIFNAAGTISFIITDAGDPEPRILEFSPGAEKIFGYAREEMIGAPVSVLHLPEDAARFPEAHQRMREGKESFRGEATLVRKSGERFPALFTTYPLTDADGRMYAALGVSIDISERKKLETQLQQTYKMEAVGALAGGIAHDFNNILGIILGNAELAMDDTPEWHAARVNLTEIRTACIRARDVIRQLLSFSRKAEQERRPVDIAPVVKESLKLLRASIPTDIEIRGNISPDVSHILADATQIHQTLINLCTNAAHAMADNGGVLDVNLDNVTLEEPETSGFKGLAAGPYVRLTVSDTGVGMPPEVRDRVFDPYFTTKEAGKGTGMGLAVVHGIVKNHDGAVSVCSEMGKGSAFRVMFPAIREKAADAAAPSGALPAGRERILMADDEPALLDIGRRMLERLGYQVTTFTDPVAALEAFRSAPDRYDLAITDMTMPDLTGDRLATEIKNIRPGFPVILCTGFSERINTEVAAGMGIDRYIEKPLNKRDIARAIRDVLAKADQAVTSSIQDR